MASKNLDLDPESGFALATELVHLKPDFVRTNRSTWCTYVVYQIIGAQVHSFQHMNLMSVENFF